MTDPEKLYRDNAKFYRRDLRNGSIKPQEIAAYLRSDWEKDEDEFRDAYGITSFAQYKAGMLAALGSAPKKRAAPPKAKRVPKAKAARAVGISKPPGKVRSFLRGLLGKGCKC